jgi:hypothetical protein
LQSLSGLNAAQLTEYLRSAVGGVSADLEEQAIAFEASEWRLDAEGWRVSRGTLRSAVQKEGVAVWELHFDVLEQQGEVLLVEGLQLSQAALSLRAARVTRDAEGVTFEEGQLWTQATQHNGGPEQALLVSFERLLWAKGKLEASGLRWSLCGNAEDADTGLWLSARQLQQSDGSWSVQGAEFGLSTFSLPIWLSELQSDGRASGLLFPRFRSDAQSPLQLEQGAFVRLGEQAELWPFLGWESAWGPTGRLRFRYAVDDEESRGEGELFGRWDPADARLEMWLLGRWGGVFHEHWRFVLDTEFFSAPARHGLDGSLDQRSARYGENTLQVGWEDQRLHFLMGLSSVQAWPTPDLEASDFEPFGPEPGALHALPWLRFSLLSEWFEGLDSRLELGWAHYEGDSAWVQSNQPVRGRGESLKLGAELRAELGLFDGVGVTAATALEEQLYFARREDRVWAYDQWTGVDAVLELHGSWWAALGPVRHLLMPAVRWRSHWESAEERLDLPAWSRAFEGEMAAHSLELSLDNVLLAGDWRLRLELLHAFFLGAHDSLSQWSEALLVWTWEPGLGLHGRLFSQVGGTGQAPNQQEDGTQWGGDWGVQWSTEQSSIAYTQVHARVFDLADAQSPRGVGMWRQRFGFVAQEVELSRIEASWLLGDVLIDAAAALLWTPLLDWGLGLSYLGDGGCWRVGVRVEQYVGLVPWAVMVNFELFPRSPFTAH